MKKALSLILAIILTFSMCTLAFAAETSTAITKDEAKDIALKHVKYETEIEIPLITPLITNGTYNDDIQGEVEVYNVSTRLRLYSGNIASYYTVVDKYNGKIYYQKATLVDLPSIVDLTEDQALSLAYEALGVNPDNASVLSKEGTEGKAPYTFVFVEGYTEKYECTVKKGDLFSVVIDDIKVSKHTVTNSVIQALAA